MQANGNFHRLDQSENKDQEAQNKDQEAQDQGSRIRLTTIAMVISMLCASG